MQVEDRDWIHPSGIKTEEQLTAFLAGLGHASQPVPRQDNRERIRRKVGYEGQPQRYLPAGEQDPTLNLTLPALVSIEDNALCIYDYDEGLDRFQLWQRVPDESEPREISALIREAMRPDVIFGRLRASTAARVIADLCRTAIILLIFAFAAVCVTGVALPMLVLDRQAMPVGLPFQVGVFNLSGFPPGMYRVTACPPGQICDQINPAALGADLGLWFVGILAGLLLRLHYRKAGAGEMRKK